MLTSTLSLLYFGSLVGPSCTKPIFALPMLCNESCKTDNKAVVGVEVIQEVQRALSVQVALSHRESGDGSCLSNQTTAESAQIQSAQMHDAQMQSAQMQSVQLQSAQLQNQQMLSCFQTSSLQQTSSLSS